MPEMKRSFAFVVLTYNHEEYIVEHLESIKFLVESYGQELHVDIVVNDDCSADKTTFLVSKWLEYNNSIFRNIIKIFNERNVGTCKSVLNAIAAVDTDALKITAGDDVYSFENIFEHAFLEDDCAIRSGIPLSLIDGVLSENKSDIFNIVASQVIYCGKPLIDRFSYLSNNNAPNIIYNKNLLVDDNVREFLNQFDVIEDWPIQIAIARKNPDKKFDLKYKVFVYYRRTSGSIYLVAGSRFYKDKMQCYIALMEFLGSPFRKFLLGNRLFLFKNGSRLLNKLVNFSFYIYLLNVFSKVHFVVLNYFRFNSRLDLHRRHYGFLVQRSKFFMESFVNLNIGGKL